MNGTPVIVCSCGATRTGGSHACLPGRPGPAQVTSKPKPKGGRP